MCYLCFLWYIIYSLTISGENALMTLLSSLVAGTIIAATIFIISSRWSAGLI